MTSRIESAWFDLGRLQLHARVSAEPPAGRPAVVLVHGLIVSSRYMLPTAEALAGEFRVLAPDLPGFGRTRGFRRTCDIAALAAWLLRWMDAAGLERPMLIGNSLGCQVLAELAAGHPDRVARMVLIGPTYDPSALRAGIQMLRWLADVPLERASLLFWNLVDVWDAGLLRGLRTFQASLGHAIERRLPEVEARTLVVRGSHDPIVPDHWARRAARLLPRGSFLEVPGPHCLNYSAAEALVGRIRGFLLEENGS